VGVNSDWNSEGPRQAEVSDLDCAVLVDQQILRLQIAVKDSTLKGFIDKCFTVNHVILKSNKRH
jgi:hypothetical protein